MPSSQGWKAMMGTPDAVISESKWMETPHAMSTRESRPGLLIVGG